MFLKLVFDEEALRNHELDKKLKVGNGAKWKVMSVIPSPAQRAKQTRRQEKSTHEREKGKGTSAPIDNDQ